MTAPPVAARPAFSGDYLSRRCGYGAPGEGDTLTGIENLRSSPYNDVLIGNRGSNDLIGCGGSDRLKGLADNDTLRGDGIGCGTFGADLMSGALEVDTVNLVECR